MTDKPLNLPKDPKAGTIATNFFLQEIKMKELCWSIKLELKAILPRSYRNYDVEMVFDNEPFDSRVRHVQGRITKLEKDPQLFDDVKKQELDDLRQEINDIEKERNALDNQCPTISFPGTIEELKYKGAGTVLVMNVPDSIIELMNQKKSLISYYKIELAPQE